VLLNATLTNGAGHSTRRAGHTEVLLFSQSVNKPGAFAVITFNNEFVIYFQKNHWQSEVNCVSTRSSSVF